MKSIFRQRQFRPAISGRSAEDAAAALFDKDISAELNDGTTIIDRDQNEDQWPSNKDTAEIIWSDGAAGGGN